MRTECTATPCRPRRHRQDCPSSAPTARLSRPASCPWSTCGSASDKHSSSRQAYASGRRGPRPKAEQADLTPDQRIVRAGTRWMPAYSAGRDVTSPRIDIGHLAEDLRCLGRGATPLEVERMLVEAKAPTIVDEALATRARGKRARAAGGNSAPLADGMRESRSCPPHARSRRVRASDLALSVRVDPP